MKDKTQSDRKMQLEDLRKHMKQDTPQNGLDSVSKGIIYWGHPKGLSDELMKVSQETVCCIHHGAILCVTHWEVGSLWRCPTCNEGGLLIK